MADDEQYLLSEYNRLVDQHNRLVHEIEQLAAELEYSANRAIEAINTTIGVSSIVLPELNHTLVETTDISNVTKEVYMAILDLEEKYFMLKNVSTASKKLTELDDIYEKKFRFYNKLRKITLGYVIGIDKNIISNESLRKSVEVQQLQNSDYWLSFALSSVMLWIHDDKDASLRALNNALALDEYKTALFMMLVNLRFGRAEAARKWYTIFSKDTDIFNIGDEWEFVLEAYLNRAFGNDKEFEKQVKDEFNRLLVEMKNSYANFDQKVVNKATNYAYAFPHSASESFDLLQENCIDHKRLMTLLTQSQKNVELAKYYQSILEKKEDVHAALSEEIENVLYNLISAYDTEEYAIIRQIKLNEYIIRAKGNLATANEMFKQQVEEYEANKSLFDLMSKFAFADIHDNIDIKTRKFAISFMKDSLKDGYKVFHDQLAENLDNQYQFDIDGCVFSGNDQTINESRNAIVKHYKQNKRKFLFKDKKVKTLAILFAVFAVLTGLLTGGLIARLIGFDKLYVTLTFGAFVLLTVLFGVLYFFKRHQRLLRIKKKEQDSLMKLQRVNEEFIRWKKCFSTSIDENQLLLDTLDKFQ